MLHSRSLDTEQVSSNPPQMWSDLSGWLALTQTRCCQRGKTRRQMNTWMLIFTPRWGEQTGSTPNFKCEEDVQCHSCGYYRTWRSGTFIRKYLVSVEFFGEKTRKAVEWSQSISPSSLTGCGYANVTCRCRKWQIDRFAWWSLFIVKCRWQNCVPNIFENHSVLSGLKVKTQWIKSDQTFD